MSIGETIREARMRKGWNQSELARAVGVSPQSVQQWEYGHTAPTRRHWPKVARALELDESLTGWSEYDEILILLKAMSETHRQLLKEIARALINAKRGKEDPESLQESKKEEEP